MDSSPDLSLKLRRGSSDSRDSFYMPFAQGIDSDIEEVTTVQSNPPPPPPPELEIPPPPAPLPEPSTSEGDDVDNGDNFEPYQKPYEPPYPEPYLEQYREPSRESYREPYMQEPYLEPYPEELEKIQEPNFEDFRVEISPGISPEDLQEIPMHIEQTQEVPIQYSAETLLELQKELDKEQSLLQEPEEVTPEEIVDEKQNVEDLEETKEEIFEENEQEPQVMIPIEIKITTEEYVEESVENQENEEKEREEEEIEVEIEKEEEPEVEIEEENEKEEEEEEQKEEISELPVSPKIEKQKSLETPRQLSSEASTETPNDPQVLVEDDADTSATITVIPTKVKTPSSSSSSISSSHNELILDNIPPSIGRQVKPMSPPIRKQPSKEKVEKIPTPPPPLALTPPAHIRSLNDMQTKNFDSDSIDSINAIDCKIDDDNRDTSASDSLQRTPPPLPQLSLEKSGIMEAASQQLVPSPSSPDNVLVSPETFSHHSSPAKSSRVIHYAQYVTTVDETKSPSSVRSSQQHLLQQSHRSTPTSPPPPFQSVQASMTPTTSGLSRESMAPYSDTQQLIPARQTSPLQILEAPLKSSMSPSQHLAVLYQTQHHPPVHPILTPTRRPSRLPDQSRFLAQQQALAAENKITPGDVFCNTLSALYGKILVVMGIAFPMAEVISTYIPPSFYEVFYLYLYIGSMLVLLFMYFTLLWRSKSTAPVSNASTHKTPTRPVNSSSDSGDESDQEESENSLHNARKGSKNIVPVRRPSILASSSVASRTQHFGSFYLRMGAVVFGIGSMIYSGLELGQYFEIEKDSKCHNYLLAITPATRITFIFVQMYFIFFLNNEQINVYRHKIIARFGLMHVIGTNLAVWFSVLIQETKHEILTFYDPENRTLKISHRLGNKPHVSMDPASLIPHIRIARGLKGPHNIFECRRTNILGTLVQDASPFLFPCTIEYSLICAAILYVMWRKVSRPQVEETPVRYEGLHPYKRSPHHYSVDCASAQKGLFIGILILVLTIISLILFFVLISRQEFVNLAVFEVNVCECILYVSTILAVLIGLIQVRPLQYDATRRFSLDDILLVGSQSGSFLYSTFTIIGAHLTLRHNTILVLITALASLVETACQTMFILDASRRSAATPEQIRKKPGREIVTFLLVSNLAMWAINTLEKSRAESHPIQLHFYGLWAWTIITHVSMPLAIFYRFHSTVCLCEIWKRTYKMKPAYM